MNQYEARGRMEYTSVPAAGRSALTEIFREVADNA